MAGKKVRRGARVGETKFEGPNVEIGWLGLKLLPELKKLVDIEARKQNLPSNEYVVRELARLFGRPELGIVPRKWRTPRNLIAS